MTTYVLRSEQVKQRCIEEIQSAYKPLEVVIREQKRSNPQNAFAHKLWQIIADHIGVDMEEIKLKVKFSVLPLREVQTCDKTYLYPVSTTDLTKADFSNLIEATLALGMSLGLTMPSPAFYGLQEAA